MQKKTDLKTRAASGDCAVRAALASARGDQSGQYNYDLSSVASKLTSDRREQNKNPELN
jgi:hypothetical protein